MNFFAATFVLGAILLTTDFEVAKCQRGVRLQNLMSGINRKYKQGPVNSVTTTARATTTAMKKVITTLRPTTLKQPSNRDLEAPPENQIYDDVQPVYDVGQDPIIEISQPAKDFGVTTTMQQPKTNNPCKEQVQYENICLLKNSVTAYYYDSKNALCQKFTPCSGNSNGSTNYFATFDECKARCPTQNITGSFVKVLGKCADGVVLVRQTARKMTTIDCARSCTETKVGTCVAFRYFTMVMAVLNRNSTFCELLDKCSSIGPENDPSVETWRRF